MNKTDQDPKKLLFNPTTGQYLGWIHNGDHPDNEKKQKFEKIEKMAWELFKEHQYVEIVCDNSTTEEVLPLAWKSAEDFYNFAKEKEGELQND